MHEKQKQVSPAKVIIMCSSFGSCRVNRYKRECISMVFTMKTWSNTAKPQQLMQCQQTKYTQFCNECKQGCPSANTPKVEYQMDLWLLKGQLNKPCVVYFNRMEIFSKRLPFLPKAIDSRLHQHFSPKPNHLNGLAVSTGYMKPIVDVSAFRPVTIRKALACTLHHFLENFPVAPKIFFRGQECGFLLR